MSKEKRSFFERLTGSQDESDYEEQGPQTQYGFADKSEESSTKEDGEEGQMAVDVFRTENDIVIQAIIAGVRSENLDVSITRDSVNIKGRRENTRRTGRENYLCDELYWGSFGRDIKLPDEIDADSAEASTKNGILTIKLPLINKGRVQKIRVKEE